MKEASDIHFIESQHEHFLDPSMGHNFFEEEKIAYHFDEDKDKDVDQQCILKTPKSKRGRKFSIKNNPQDNSASKLNKIKQKKYKCMTVDRQKNPNQMFGHWSVEQNKRYHWFLEIYHTHFMNRSLRRMDRIFTSMAKFVDSREAQQCRSHHQKMQKKHKTFAKILLNLRSTYYNSNDVICLKEDIERNDLNIQIADPLLTQFDLMEKATMKEISNDSQQEKEEAKSQNDLQEEKPKDKQDFIREQIGCTAVDMIEQVLAPDVESSKNYYKFLPHNQQRNNILDDGYESNFSFGFLI